MPCKACLEQELPLGKVWSMNCLLCEKWLELGSRWQDWENFSSHSLFLDVLEKARQWLVEAYCHHLYKRIYILNCNIFFIGYTTNILRTINVALLKAHSLEKRFEINFFVQQNASKFAIFIEKENPHSFFRFSFRATLSFPLWMPWSFFKNMKVAQNEKP